MVFVLPPLIWAEAMQYHPGNLYCLQDYDLRFGKDVAEVLALAAKATDAQLWSLDPLVRRRSAVHKRCLSDLSTCPSWRVEHAKKIKEGNRADMKKIECAAQEILRQDRDALRCNEEPILSRHMDSLDDYMVELKPLLQKTPFRNPEDDPAPARTYWELLMSGNFRITNFVRFLLAITYAKTGAWKDGKLDLRGSSGNRDDIPDMTLPLYAEQGDIIVTGDKTIARLFRLAEPPRRVRVMTWGECLKYIL